MFISYCLTPSDGLLFEMLRQGWKEDFLRVRTILARGPAEAAPLMVTSKHHPNYALGSEI